MGLNLQYNEGQTPVDEEEKEGLKIKTINTHAELDEFEQLNIQKAIEWTLHKKFSKEKILSEDFVMELHKKMFGDVWAWAGKFRLTEKNLGIKSVGIGTALKQLNDDCLFWMNSKTYSEDEIAMRYKHRLVSIHCFSNGNGRHSRLMADVIASQVFGKAVFSWGNAVSAKKGKAREEYLSALRIADKGNISALVAFSRR